jgi:dCTP deaminase
MAFWSGEKLELELPKLVDDFDKDRIDCATYRLRVGDQAFVTDNFRSASPSAPLISVLGQPPNHTIRIAPGQFAFLLTLEEVTVPSNAIALISMRAGYKFKGLINVSGFHVDPGWRGKLLFSVFNAGPTEVILARGEPAFLIVYGDLDRPSGKVYRGASLGQNTIKPDLLQNMTSQVFSPQVLQQRLAEVDAKMGRIEVNTSVAAGVAAGLAVVTAIVIAAVALLPSWTGVVIARTLDAANYELKQKQDKDPAASAAPTASTVTAPAPSAPSQLTPNAKSAPDARKP